MAEELSKEVVDIFKREGLSIAEETAVNAVRAAFRILEMIVPRISTGLGIAIGPIVKIYEPKVMAMLDKIDGVDNPEY